MEKRDPSNQQSEPGVNQSAQDRSPYLESIAPNSERLDKDWKINKARVSISGKGSTGNSSLAESLAEKYHLPRTRIFHVGDKMRKGYTGIAPFVLSIDEHRMTDYGTMLNVLAAPHIDPEPAIFDAKLGGVMIHYLRRLAEDHDLPRLIKEMDQQHAFNYYPDYAFLRDLKDGKIILPDVFTLVNWATQVKRLEIAMSKDSTANLTESQIRRTSSRRDRTNLEEWIEAHPWMRDWHNVLERDATDENGRLIYDRIINSSRRTAEEVTQETHGIFVQEGVVVERGRIKPPTLLLPNTPAYLDSGDGNFNTAN